MREAWGVGRDGVRGQWAQLFDPVANARALGEVQARGLQAAGELVERVIASVGDGRSPLGGPVADGATTEEGQTSIGHLLEVWIDLFRRTAETVVGSGEAMRPGPTRPGSLDVDVTTGRGAGTVRVVVDPTGADADASPPEVWLHNGTADDLGPVALICTPPRAPDGIALAGEVVFDPAQVDELPARSSRGIAVRVVATGPLVPGTYRSLVQATGAPEVWLPLEVVVPEPDA